jgi:hypothetical protein
MAVIKTLWIKHDIDRFCICNLYTFMCQSRILVQRIVHGRETTLPEQQMKIITRKHNILMTTTDHIKCSCSVWQGSIGPLARRVSSDGTEALSVDPYTLRGPLCERSLPKIFLHSDQWRTLVINCSQTLYQKMLRSENCFCFITREEHVYDSVFTCKSEPATHSPRTAVF